MEITYFLTTFIVLFTSLCLVRYSSRNRFQEKTVKKLLVVFMILESPLILFTIFYAMKLDTFMFLYEALFSTMLMVQIWRIQDILIHSKNLEIINTFS